MSIASTATSLPPWKDVGCFDITTSTPTPTATIRNCATKPRRVLLDLLTRAEALMYAPRDFWMDEDVARRVCRSCLADLVDLVDDPTWDVGISRNPKVAGAWRVNVRSLKTRRKPPDSIFAACCWGKDRAVVCAYLRETFSALDVLAVESKIKNVSGMAVRGTRCHRVVRVIQTLVSRDPLRLPTVILTSASRMAVATWTAACPTAEVLPVHDDDLDVAGKRVVVDADVDVDPEMLERLRGAAHWWQIRYPSPPSTNAHRVGAVAVNGVPVGNYVFLHMAMATFPHTWRWTLVAPDRASVGAMRWYLSTTVPFVDVTTDPSRRDATVLIVMAKDLAGSASSRCDAVICLDGTGAGDSRHFPQGIPIFEVAQEEKRGGV